MERAKFLLLLTFIFTVITSLIVLIDISRSGLGSYSQSKLSTQKMFKEAGESAVLIKIEGEIHSGKSTYSSTGADTILEQLREIETKPLVKGILIEINSPGGTVAASQEIFEELMHLRKEKKIVVSMKDLAASGGYYIAASADYIFAEPGTITGSIGVIAMSPNISGLLEKYDVKMNVYKQGKYKDILSMFRDPSKEESEIIRTLLSDTYKRFIKDISRGRNIPKSEVEKGAEGRIFSGEEAIKYHLVDAIGGRREAMTKLSQLSGYEGTLPLLEEEESPLNRFMELFTMKASSVLLFGQEKNLVLEKIYKNPVLLMIPTNMRF